MTPTMGVLKKPAPPMFILIHSNWVPTRINHGLCKLTLIYRSIWVKIETMPYKMLMCIFTLLPL